MNKEELSSNQKKFVKDIEAQGLKVDYSYSGRGMFGKTCPSVTMQNPSNLGTKAKTEIDHMGLGYIIYAQS